PAAATRRARRSDQSAWRSSSRRISAAKRLELVANGLDVEAEATRGLGLVVARGPERLEDQDSLGFGRGDAMREHDAADVQPRPTLAVVIAVVIAGIELEVEIAGAQRAAAGSHGRALDHVAKLADVAWPVMTVQDGPGV